MSIQTVIGVLVLLAVGGTAFGLYGQNRRLNAELDRLVAVEPEPVEVPVPDADATKELEQLRDEVRSLKQRLEEAEERAADAVKSQRLPKKPPFALLANALELDATQEASFRKDLSEMQTDFLELLSEVHDDGTVPLEEIARAEELGPGHPERAEIFVKVLSLKVPGSEDSYLTRAVEMTTSMHKRMLAYLRPQQKEILFELDVDWLGVKMD